MNCELYDDMLDDYVDGARSVDGADPRLAAFETHLSGCIRCQAMVDDFTSIRRTAAALDEHLPPPRLWAKIASAIEDDARRPWWERSFANVFSAWIPVAAAGSVALLLASASLIVWRPCAVRRAAKRRAAGQRSRHDDGRRSLRAGHRRAAADC